MNFICFLTMLQSIPRMTENYVDDTKIITNVSLFFFSTLISLLLLSYLIFFPLLHGLQTAFRSCGTECMRVIWSQLLTGFS